MTCQISWSKSKPALWAPSRGAPKLAAPETTMAGPEPALGEARRAWPRRANWTRSSLRRVLPKEEMSWADAESIRSSKSVARSRVFRPPPMLKGDAFLKKK